MCKCGKNYKSYPALYTHIKKKHQGNFSCFMQKTVIGVNSNSRTKELDESLLQKLILWNKRFKKLTKQIIR